MRGLIVLHLSIQCLLSSIVSATLVTRSGAIPVLQCPDKEHPTLPNSCARSLIGADASKLEGKAVCDTFCRPQDNTAYSGERQVVPGEAGGMITSLAYDQLIQGCGTHENIVNAFVNGCGCYEGNDLCSINLAPPPAKSMGTSPTSAVSSVSSSVVVPGIRIAAIYHHPLVAREQAEFTIASEMGKLTPAVDAGTPTETSTQSTSTSSETPNAYSQMPSSSSTMSAPPAITSTVTASRIPRTHTVITTAAVSAPNVSYLGTPRPSETSPSSSSMQTSTSSSSSSMQTSTSSSSSITSISSAAPMTTATTSTYTPLPTEKCAVKDCAGTQGSWPSGNCLDGIPGNDAHAPQKYCALLCQKQTSPEYSSANPWLGVSPELYNSWVYRCHNSHNMLVEAFALACACINKDLGPSGPSKCTIPPSPPVYPSTTTSQASSTMAPSTTTSSTMSSSTMTSSTTSTSSTSTMQSYSMSSSIMMESSTFMSTTTTAQTPTYSDITDMTYTTQAMGIPSSNASTLTQSDIPPTGYGDLGTQMAKSTPAPKDFNPESTAAGPSNGYGYMPSNSTSTRASPTSMPSMYSDTPMVPSSTYIAPPPAHDYYNNSITTSATMSPVSTPSNWTVYPIKKCAKRSWAPTWPQNCFQWYAQSMENTKTWCKNLCTPGYQDSPSYRNMLVYSPDILGRCDGSYLKYIDAVAEGCGCFLEDAVVATCTFGINTHELSDADDVDSLVSTPMSYQTPIASTPMSYQTPIASTPMTYQTPEASTPMGYETPEVSTPMSYQTPVVSTPPSYETPATRPSMFTTLPGESTSMTPPSGITPTIPSYTGTPGPSVAPCPAPLNGRKGWPKGNCLEEAFNTEEALRPGNVIDRICNQQCGKGTDMRWPLDYMQVYQTAMQRCGTIENLNNALGAGCGCFNYGWIGKCVISCQPPPPVYSYTTQVVVSLTEYGSIRTTAIPATVMNDSAHGTPVTLYQSVILTATDTAVYAPTPATKTQTETSMQIMSNTTYSWSSTMPVYAAPSTMSTMTYVPSNSAACTCGNQIPQCTVPPGPVQSGSHNPMCNQWYKVIPGDNCDKIAGYFKDQGVAAKDIIGWNQAAQPSCESIQSGYWICVGILHNKYHKDQPIYIPTATELPEYGYTKEMRYGPTEMMESTTMSSTSTTSPMMYSSSSMPMSSSSTSTSMTSTPIPQYEYAAQTTPLMPSYGYQSSTSSSTMSTPTTSMAIVPVGVYASTETPATSPPTGNKGSYRFRFM
ncbi:hypothetical protein ABW21_db0205229 [Orbilia brochopaga]|nr:hypothetical protein ABW21_db0205229 [Drechslerella brochopaga]